jgi:hypothetical protein
VPVLLKPSRFFVAAVRSNSRPPANGPRSDHLDPHRAVPVAQRELRPARHRLVGDAERGGRQGPPARAVPVQAGPVPGGRRRSIHGHSSRARAAAGGELVSLGRRTNLALARVARAPRLAEPPAGPRPGPLVGSREADADATPGGRRQHAPLHPDGVADHDVALDAQLRDRAHLDRNLRGGGSARGHGAERAARLGFTRAS